jgi:hypothetical protein
VTQLFQRGQKMRPSKALARFENAMLERADQIIPKRNCRGPSALGLGVGKAPVHGGIRGSNPRQDPWNEFSAGVVGTVCRARRFWLRIQATTDRHCTHPSRRLYPEKGSRPDRTRQIAGLTAECDLST